jgi:hypothetical protein
VSAGFDNLLALLDVYGDGIRLQCAEATMDGELETSGCLLETSKNVPAFVEEVKTLSARWSKGELRLPAAIPKKQQSCEGRRLGKNANGL